MELLGEQNSLAFEEFSMLGPVRVKLSETKEKLKLEFREAAHISASSILDLSDI